MLFERWTKRESQSIQINQINLNRLHKMPQETGAFLLARNSGAELMAVGDE
jgi:hypothetical protein